MGERSTRPALVLSGGGVRGAYEVGAVAGMVEALGLGPDDPAPFRIFAGTSVGAINAVYLAANANRGDMAVSGLEDMWRSMRLDVHLRLELFDRMLPGPLKRLWRRRPKSEHGFSVLDSRPLGRLVREGTPWQQLRDNIATGTIDALLVAALDLASGRTTMFADLAPGVEFRASRDPLRQAKREQITAEHVMASSAIPILFPARRIGNAYYCDGGLRFNTPIAPAIRTGADRLVIVPMLRMKRTSDINATMDEYPKISFLAGKVLNALIADAVGYDLQVLSRFNRLIGVLEEALTEQELASVDEVMIEARGAPYRRLGTLVLRPSADIGLMAGDHLRSRSGRSRTPQGWVLREILRRSKAREADWASYVLFDGEFAGELIELGKRDSLARADEIRDFFEA